MRTLAAFIKQDTAILILNPDKIYLDKAAIP